MAKRATRDLGRPSKTKVRAPKGRNLIAVIGIDAYALWPKLKRAVSDARGTHKLFTEKLGFVSPVPPLFNSDATQDAITSLIQETLPPKLEPDDSLVLFFAGHGHTRESKVGENKIETGYLIPVEARLDRWSDYIKIDSFLDDVAQLPARHVLLIVDACHSGFAVGNAMQTFRSKARYAADLSSRVSRKVITSAMREQLALDNGPVAGHSLFTGTLVHGFNWGKADTDGNGLVTSSELGLFLQQQVGQASESKQTPDFGSFHFDDRGELVISLRDDNFDALKARAFSSLQQAQMAEFRELAGRVMALRPDSPEALYLQYRLHLHAGDIDQAHEMVRRLLLLDLPEGTIPLTQRDLDELHVQIGYWKAALSIPASEVPLEVDLLAGPEKRHLLPAPRDTWEGCDAFAVTNGCVARYRVKNLTESLAHIYHISITPEGRLRVGPLLESDEFKIDGLPPGASGYGLPFLVKGVPRVRETRLFYSKDRVSALLFPPGTATRAVIPDFLLRDSAPILMKRIWQKITDASAQPDRP